MRFLKIEFIAIVLGIMAGIGLLTLEVFFDSWDFIGRVSGTPTQIISSYPVYVQTSDEHVYFCYSYSEDCVPVETGTYQSSHAKGYVELCPRKAPNLQTPLYPGNVVASAVGQICGPEGGFVDYTIALDDGSVWIWRARNSGLATIGYGILGAFVGFVSGILLYLIIRLRSLRRDKAKRSMP